jgi:uncharacterized protein (DUF1684 family)
MNATSDTDPASDDARSDWLAWRARREETLREPNGWLSLTSLTWLEATPRPIPALPGLWSATGPGDTGQEDPSALDSPRWQARALLPDGSGVTQDGASVAGTVAIALGPGDSDRSLALGDLIAEVAQRGDGVMVRIRDPRAVTRAGFRGVPVFDFDPDWIRPARFTADAEPHGITVPSARPGLGTRLTAIGRAAVALPDGSVADLLVTGSPDAPSIIFHDTTNGAETSPWRSAPVLLPETGDASRDALVDFNRSTNFPAHFTAYGTCPTPPEGNDLPVAVTAGERAPAAPAPSEG